MRKLTRESLIKLLKSGAVGKIFITHQSDFRFGKVVTVGKELVLNFLYTPRYIDPEVWKEIVARTFCEANGFEERRLHNAFASQVNILYQLYDVYKNPSKSKGINLLHVHDKFEERMLKTNYSPSFQESNQIVSRLELLKKPELKLAYCNEQPNDDDIYFQPDVLTIRGQPWSNMFNMWATLIMVNKQYEAIKRNHEIPKQLIAIENDLVNPHIIEGTLDFIAGKGKDLGLFIVLIRT